MVGQNEFLNLGKATSLGEGKLNSNQLYFEFDLVAYSAQGSEVG